MEVLQNSFLQHLHWVCHEGIKARHQVETGRTLVKLSFEITQ